MATVPLASEAQINFIQGLVRTKDTDRLTDEQRAWLEYNLDALDKLTGGRGGQASRVIDALKALPNREKINVGGVVPNGRYAVTEADGVLRFYKVNTPTEGKWAGFTFVEIQASDELYPLKGDHARKTRVLALIAADVQAAMLRYGQEIGNCGHCGRTLTNPISRSIGIGPICRAKMEW